MRLIQTTLIALLAAGSAAAQAPPVPASPAVPAVAPVTAQRGRSADRAPSDEEALALAALEGLMSQSPARALPILKKVLAGSQPTIVKQRALFVLSQVDSPEAQDILVQTSRSADPVLRLEAIRSIGIGGNPKALAGLQEVYNTGSEDVKHAVLQSWLIAGDKDAVYRAALNAKTEEEATDAIHILGAMGASEELRKLGDKPNASKGLVEAFAISGDLESLRKIAETSPDRGRRIDAVRKIGIIQGDAAKMALRDIYTRSTDGDIRDAALQGMLIADDQQGVLALYKAAKTADEKRSLLRTLTLMDGDAALQAIDAALEKK